MNTGSIVAVHLPRVCFVITRYRVVGSKKGGRVTGTHVGSVHEHTTMPNGRTRVRMKISGVAVSFVLRRETHRCYNRFVH